ncbi:hypothetical protein P168DRAFT_269291 [Aspergillus campestris IBT 28561]|uniref:Uncharacterized protein n=1 Tax=Aspergillus campestris (strain IBT 28561) TaxID=1392248 RepID=A0A2I1D3F0_ASPC2|nr:uncharacterized protein P168DRAFT_269291 [Aspergillus campestris IBT 28561]PKY04403.1 hypothetical protein P168DRAFT_269291 [Aspergillus campestris IBT 28561]
MTTKAYILVYEGTPLDYTEYRHTALHFVFAQGSSRTMHVVGTQGLFEFEEGVDQDPSEGGELVRMIPVADIPRSVAGPAIKKAVSATPVKNGRADLEWNCQNWVGDALAQMVEGGFVTAAERAAAIDSMVDACLEAKDD